MGRRPTLLLVLADSGIVVIPDVLCNGGGVTVSYFEWVQDIQQLMWGEGMVNHKLTIFTC
jgi:glutamate dehydrogenase (NAD(P)+)